MIRTFALTLALSGLLAGSALAQGTLTPAPSAPAVPGATTELAPVSNPDDCLKTASDLALDAEDKKIAEDKLDKIEELLVKMEAHCDARQFSEAIAVAKDIKTMIEKQ